MNYDVYSHSYFQYSALGWLARWLVGWHFKKSSFVSSLNTATHLDITFFVFTWHFINHRLCHAVCYDVSVLSANLRISLWQRGPHWRQDRFHLMFGNSSDLPTVWLTLYQHSKWWPSVDPSLLWRYLLTRNIWYRPLHKHSLKVKRTIPHKA